MTHNKRDATVPRPCHGALTPPGFGANALASLEQQSVGILPQTAYPTRVRRKRVLWEERACQKNMAVKDYPTRVRRNFEQNREPLVGRYQLVMA